MLNVYLAPFYEGRSAWAVGFRPEDGFTITSQEIAFAPFL